MAKVGCEGDDGLLRVHNESETCDVCTHSTTNAAARELLEDVLGNLLGEEAIVWVETTTDGKYAEKMHALCNKARQAIDTLTQQQGGEQEVTDAMVARGVAGYQAAWDRHEKIGGDKPLSFETLVRAALIAAMEGTP